MIYRIFGSIFFFSNTLYFVKTEPVISISNLLDRNDDLVFLLDDFRVSGSQHALSVGNCKKPIFALVIMNSNFKRSF